ncbi:glycosyltransferase family 8 protein [Mariannaea sp. PMI_226]|nr:glycosyltransferase family 8 protein [Mariannaea sp. PMI_226]
MADKERAVNSSKVWVSLITNLNYLPGLLTLNHCLRRVNSKYPLVALYTESFPESGRAALAARGISSHLVPFLAPSNSKNYADDPRFNDCWTKLVVFSLTQYDRVVQLDSDMLVLRNMDELMDLDLDHPSVSATGDAQTSPRVFAASHACVCNPLKRTHYPADWIAENCAFTSQHGDPVAAQTIAADPSSGLGKLNSGLLVLNPSDVIFEQIIDHMNIRGTEYQFPDQDLLAELYAGRWVSLPYIYNALKTLRSPGVHDAIWRDDHVKNVHFILSPKPWDEIGSNGEWTGKQEMHKWWFDTNNERLTAEKAQGIN